MVSRVDFSFRTHGAPDSPRPRAASDAFQVLVIGDFGGTRTSTAAPMRVSIDNFDNVIGVIGPKLTLKLAENRAICIEIRELSDFHPDRLVRQLPECVRLLDLRDRLGDPKTYHEAVRELGAEAHVAQEAKRPPSDNKGAFESLLGGSAAQPDNRTATDSDRIAAMIRELVSPHVDAGADDRQSQFLALVDESLTALLRELLHDPGFQRLEMGWRGLHWLVSSIYDDAAIRVTVADMDVADRSALDRLAEAAAKSADIPGGDRFSLILANADFGEDPQSLTTLRELATLGDRLHAPVIAGASPHLAGITSFEGGVGEPGAVDDDELQHAWNELRASPVSDGLILAAPRFLVRRPYGKGSDEIDRFAFEELPSRPAHEIFAWCNSAFLCARLVTEAIQRDDLEPGVVASADCDDMPLVIYNDGSGRAIKPSAECLISETDGRSLLAVGISPVLSYRNEPRVQLQQLRSIAFADGPPPIGL